MTLKYSSQLAHIIECPPRSSSCRSLRAFRFVFEDPDHRRNHLPPLGMSPGRRLPGGTEAECSGWALSFYASIEAAREAFRRLVDMGVPVHRVIGTHIASCDINEADGKATDPDEEGHFDLHEDEEASFAGRLSIEEET